MLIAGGDPALESARSVARNKDVGGPSGRRRDMTRWMEEERRWRGKGKGTERGATEKGAGVRFLEKGVYGIGVCGKERGRLHPHNGVTDRTTLTTPFK